MKKIRNDNVRCPNCLYVVPELELEECHGCKQIICPVCAEDHFNEHDEDRLKAQEVKPLILYMN